MIRPDLFGRKKVLLIFGGRSDHDDGHDNLTGVDSTPVNCGEENNPDIQYKQRYATTTVTNVFTFFFTYIDDSNLINGMYIMSILY